MGACVIHWDKIDFTLSDAEIERRYSITRARAGQRRRELGMTPSNAIRGVKAKFKKYHFKVKVENRAAFEKDFIKLIELHGIESIY